MMTKTIVSTIFLVLILAVGCAPQENVVSAKSPFLVLDDESNPSSGVKEQSQPNESNETGTIVPIYPTGNADETELVRQKRYSTLLDFTDLRFEDCPKLNSELRLQLEQVRDGLDQIEQRIDDAYDKVLEERLKDEQLSQQEATPTQLSRQKGYVKGAEKIHTKRLLERDETKQQEEQLVSTLNALHDECIKAEIRERKEAIDAAREN